MSISRTPFRSITRDILRRIITIAAMSVVVIAAVQSGVQYRSEMQRVDALVETLLNSHIPLLTVALWDIEPNVARRQVALMAEHQEIRNVLLTTSTGMSFRAGDIEQAAGSKAKADVTMTIPHPREGSEPLGRLTVGYDLQLIQRNILMSVATGTLKFTLFILFVCLVVYRVMVFRLKQPLRQIADYCRQLSPDRDNPPLLIRRPGRQWRDEIDLVAEGFETLREAIARYCFERDRAMAALAGERDQLEQRVEDRTRELNEHRRELFRLSRTDHLTGLANRRNFDETKVIEARRALRTGTPISLVMIDVDHFKAYNDRYGHAKGDECLVRLAEVMRDHCRRAGEMAVRLGGEEFALLLPGQGSADARELADRLRMALFDANIEHEGSPIGRVTVSLGCATWELGAAGPADDTLFDRLMSQADKRLYRAKFSGRNRVVAGPDEQLAAR